MNPLFSPQMLEARLMAGKSLVEQERDKYSQNQDAYRQFLGDQMANPPQMQMPTVEPNRNAALLGGLAALIGALTGDKSAVPAFGQFAGGLQQNAQAKAQRLLQEQQMKNQQAELQARARKELLGFDLERAGQEYQNAAQREQANQKAVWDATESGRERADRMRLETIRQQGLGERAQMGLDARMAAINKSTDARKKYDEMVALGTTPEQALDVAYGIALYDEKVKGAQASTALADAKTKYTDTLTKYYPQKFDFDKKKEEFKQWSATEGLRLRQAAESRMAAGGGQKVSYKFEDDPAWYSLETRLKNLDLENMSHDLQNVGYAEELKKAEGYQEGPTKQQLLKFYPEQIAVHSKRMQEIQKRRIAIRAEQLKREAEIMAAKQAGGGASRPFPRGISQWDAQIQASAKRHGVDPELVKAVMLQESGGNARARSPVGAIGLMQLMPGTARGLGVNPNDPAQNIEGGVRYLAQQLKAFGGDVSKALAAYNAGPGAVRKYKGVPPYKETKHYVKTITSRYKGR